MKIPPQDQLLTLETIQTTLNSNTQLQIRVALAGEIHFYIAKAEVTSCQGG